MVITKKEAKENAGEYALRQIRNNIIALELKPGSTISENELATELGISRTPVREALQELQKNKLIEVYPQRGIVISHIDFEIINEMVFLRKALEKAVVEELCDSISEEDFIELEKNIQLQELYFNQNNSKKMLELDNEFHRLLFVLCRKRRIYDLMEATQGHFDRIRTLSLQSVRDLKIIDDHRLIINALRERNKSMAAELMLNHLSRYKVDQIEIMEKYPEYFQ